MGPLQPTLALPVKVTLIAVSIMMLREETDVPVRDFVSDSDGVEIVTGATGDLERICGVGTCVHTRWDRWAVCVAADSAG